MSEIALAELCATVMADGITSANIVGYNTQTKEAGKKFPSLCACFIPVDGSATFKLKELKPTGMKSMDGDMIQTLNPATTVQNGQYFYFSEAEALELEEQDPGTDYHQYIGWWNGNPGDSDPADDTPITVGTAFLGMILSGESTSFQSSGEAPTDATKFTTDGGKYPFFGNYLPKDLALKDIVPVGMKSMDGDMIQTLNPATTVQNGQYFYFSLAEALELEEQDPGTDYHQYIGWWNGNPGDSDRADDTPVPAGTAFLGMILSSTDPIEYQFPSVLAE